MEYSQACSEVWYLLKNLKKSELMKIPKNFLETIQTLKIDEYSPKIDLNIPLEEQQLSEATIGLISFIYNNYLGTNEDKIEYQNTYQEYINSISTNYEIKFKKENQSVIEKKTELIKYSDKNNIFIRILNKIKNIFTRD